MGLDNPLHIAFIVVILLLVFGARRLPEIGRSLGTGLREFKQSISGESHHSHEPQQPTLPPAAPGAPPASQAPTEPAATAAEPAGPAQDAFAQREPTATDRR
ncbi:MAG TPA: twin-arginine translocase TatA/TatE family subunit [Solirubrobacteraceae bacterium]|jgi:sec-independent protein translocase protein TatA|nr:twin-arginine translocase TatA/TatE family subunit [Solirubrobacteraceae bacterium]